jgi:hypothetical protein
MTWAGYPSYRTSVARPPQPRRTGQPTSQQPAILNYLALRLDRGRGGRPLRSGAGYVVKQREGRRNPCRIQAHLTLPQSAGQQPTIGELLGLLTSQRATTEHS